VFLIVLLVLSTLSTENNVVEGKTKECSSCHSGIKTFGFYTDFPSEVALNTTFNGSVTIINYEGSDGNPHQLRDNQFTLEIQGTGIQLAEGETYTKTCPNLTKTGSRKVSWRLVAVKEGISSLVVHINSTAYYDHEGNEPDEYRYYKRSEAWNITVKELSLLLSAYTFSLEKGEIKNYSMTMMVLENISDLKINIPDSLQEMVTFNSTHPNWTGDGFTNLSKNESVVIQFSVFSKGKVGDENKFYKIFSKLFGYISLVLLLLISALGARATFIQEIMKKIFKKTSSKIKWHCALSFLLLLLSFIHGVYHILKRNTIFLDKFDVFLGDLSFIFMVVVAINGIFQKRLVKRYGFLSWRLVHSGGSLAALITGAVHTYLLQTII